MTYLKNLADSPIVIALNYADRDRVLAFADLINPSSCRLKIGKEMFTIFGPQIVRDLQQRGFELFLDLKFHDIPSTVARAVSAAAELGIWMVSIHASGGTRMMIAARKALDTFGKEAPLLIAVTVLTSMEEVDLHSIGIMVTPAMHTERLARLTQQCGLDGVVCSAREAMQLKQKLGYEFRLVTPGIRLEGSKSEDQRRIMTPIEAQKAGVDYMVIGRPIINSANPASTLQTILSLLKRVDM